LVYNVVVLGFVLVIVFGNAAPGVLAGVLAGMFDGLRRAKKVRGAFLMKQEQNE